MIIYIERFLASLWQLTLEMSPYLMLGFLFAGILHVWVSQQKVHKYLGQHNFRSVLNASIIGVPLPLCSCGVIPAGISFYKNGASKGAAVSFITSTPQTGVDSILVTWSMLGLPMAIIRPIIAIITGVFSGWWVHKSEKQKHGAPLIHKTYDAEAPKHFGSKIAATFRYAFIDFMAVIVKWLVIGLLIAAVIDVIVPDDFFSAYMSNPFLEYLFIILVSVPLYVCSTASVPIAAVLILKGISPGAALVFLMAGPATNAAVITVVAQTLGRVTFLKYLTTIVTGAVIAGLVIDNLLPSSWFVVSENMQGHQHGVLPEWLTWASAIVMTLLVIYHIMKMLRGKFSNKKFKTREIVTGEKLHNPRLHVSGLHCNHCKMSIEKHLTQLEGVSEVKANEITGEVNIRGEIILVDDIQKIIKDIGFKLEGIID